MEKAGALKAAAARGIALVCPDTSPRGAGVPCETDAEDFGTGAGFYVDATESAWKRHYNMYSYVTEELPQVVGEALPVDVTNCSVCGHSVGGHGALILGLKQPVRMHCHHAGAPGSTHGFVCKVWFKAPLSSRPRHVRACVVLPSRPDSSPCLRLPLCVIRCSALGASSALRGASMVLVSCKQPHSGWSGCCDMCRPQPVGVGVSCRYLGTDEGAWEVRVGVCMYVSVVSVVV